MQQALAPRDGGAAWVDALDDVGTDGVEARVHQGGIFAGALDHDEGGGAGGDSDDAGAGAGSASHGSVDG